ncbi:MAG: pseudouridine synthase [Propionivibrio sp.]
MTRPPARPTLKLPVKTAPTDGSETTGQARKPVRGSFKAPKPTVGQRAKRHETIATRAAQKAQQAEAHASSPTPKPGATRTPRREAAPRVEAPAAPASEAQTAPFLPRPNKSVRDEAPKKVYPPRGIARSTGARAFPPVRTEAASETPREERKPPEAPPQPSERSAPGARKGTPPRSVERAAPVRERGRTVSPTSAPAEKRRPLKEPPRLSKRISELFDCSRREADEWIENGWVRVDGVVVTTLGTRALPKARIEIRDEAKSHRPESVTIVLNKPEGVAAGPVEGRQETAAQLIRLENRWTEDRGPQVFKATHLRGLALAGKLDAEASGMLVFTQEGSVARRIVGDDTKLEKEYLVAVEGELSAAGLKKLNFGLSLDDIKLKRAEVGWQHEGTLRFVLHESRPRQIQRMCEQVGLRVVGIKRLRIGSVSLGKLPAGQWRYLREGERF